MNAERSNALTNIIETLIGAVHLVCENWDELYITLMDEADVDARTLRAVLTHLKDARAALERAKGAIP
jgi:hypothetical protein